MIKKYRKKPIEVEAFLFDGRNGKEIKNWVGDGCSIKEDLDGNQDIYITTLEGEMKASVGNYIIKGVKGEFYPCRSEIFEETYDPC